MSENKTPAPQPNVSGEPVRLTYTNWRGETSERTIKPRYVWFGSTEWHPEPQWLLTAFDLEKNADRDFALKDFGQPPAPQSNVVGFDPFKPACPHCTWIETNLGRQLDKKCELHQKIEDLQSDLSLERSINRSSSNMMAELCQIICADDDDNPLEVARERMAEIEALEQELDAPSPREEGQ